jgi:flagellar hook-associated protein 2
VSGVSSATSGSSTTSGTLGDQPPVSFPGVASGIDYNAIIQKYTAETLQQEQPLKSQVTNINAQNSAILKIKNLIGSVQDSLTTLSNPAIFGAYKATPSNTASGSTAATLKQIPGQTALAGTTTINAQTAATATTIANNSGTANGTINATVALDTAGTSITASNGTGSSGSVTINGIQVNYDVTTQSLTTILNNIRTQTGVNYTINANGTVTLGGGGGTAVSTLGSGADSGNLLSVLKLDTAQISGGIVTSSSNIGGINSTVTLNQDSNAGFATAVTSGTFTINGVQFTVNASSDSLSDVINRINASSAGVVAQYNSATSSITLTATTPGPQSILLGKASDTSNFLTATGLNVAGATTIAGTQASVSYTDNTGPHTAYSSTNNFTDIVPGFTLTVTNSSPTTLPAGSTFYTVSVASDPTQAEAAIKTFITAYNAAISELNKDTTAPTVTTGSSTTGAQTATSSGGGVLYGNFQVSNLRDQLVQLVSGIVPNGSTSYNSLASVGLVLNTASQSVGTKSDSSDSTDSTDSSDSTLTVSGSTDGTLAALDTTTFEAAYAANTAAVQSLFTLTPPSTGSSAISTGAAGFSYQFGAFLANTNGLTTFLQNSAITPASLNGVLLTTLIDSNNQQIDSLDEQIDSITTEANNQANQLRAQFTQSESQIAELQSLQGEIAAIGH